MCLAQEGESKLADPEELLKQTRGKLTAFEVLRTACQLGQTELVAQIVAEPDFLPLEVT